MDFNILYGLLIAYGGRILLAIVFLVIGLKVIRMIAQAITKKLTTAKIDPSLQPFLISMVKVVLQVLLIISIASMIGIEVTSFIAVIGAASFAVGLALQGSLSNFAGGVLILFFKPFKVGDYIEAAGHAGSVAEIQIFHTILNTPDNKRIIVPNSTLSNSSTTNYSANPTRRIDFKFGVGYQDDIAKVRLVLSQLAESHPLIFKDPEYQIFLGEHGDSAIVFYLRVWCATENYWPIYFELMEKAKLAFDEAGINIPYPQMDVHMIKN